MATVKRRGQSWQATYRGPDGRERTRTFARKVDAETWAAEQTTGVARGIWVDSKVAKVTLRSFAKTWLAGPHDLAVRTAELYEHLLERHILPTFGDTPLSKISPSAVRCWHAGIALEHVTTAAKSYRLLSQVCRAAVTDAVEGARSGSSQQHSQQHSQAQVTAL
ncbi:MAG: N-terminal phage integrase SAM-like domain-containing protein [Acidimicrobiales bacterium]